MVFMCVWCVCIVLLISYFLFLFLYGQPTLMYASLTLFFVLVVAILTLPSGTSLLVCEEEPSGAICGVLTNVPDGGLACDITVRWQLQSGNASKSEYRVLRVHNLELH